MTETKSNWAFGHNSASALLLSNDGAGFPSVCSSTAAPPLPFPSRDDLLVLALGVAAEFFLAMLLGLPRLIQALN